MKLRFSALALAIASGMAAQTASAAITTEVNLDSTTSTAVALAQEIGLTSALPLVAGGNLDWQSKLGFGVSNGQTRYIVVQYGNAKLAAAHATGTGNIEINANAGSDSYAIVQGGQVNDAYVIYQLTAGADLPATVNLQVTTPNLYAVTQGTAITITYSLHETAVSAVSQANNETPVARLYIKSGSLTSSNKALVFTNTTNANTAAVETVFAKFCLNSTNCTSGSAVTQKVLGTMTYGVNAANYKTRDGLTAAVLANLVTTADIIVDGDFTAVNATATGNGLFIDNDGDGTDCNTASFVATLNAAKTQATFAVNATGSSATGMKVCYTVTGSTAIPEQTITSSLDVKTSPTSVTTADVAASTLGTIARDGTELQSPWLSNATGYISRVFLTNKGTASAAITNVRVLTETGNVCDLNTANEATALGTPTAIPAGGMAEYTGAMVCKSFSGTAKPRVSAIFTIAAPTNNIQGVYQIINPTTGAQMAYPLLRPGTN